MSNLHDEEAFFKKAREMAEGLTREQLIGYYMAELETCCEVEERLIEAEKALELACRTMLVPDGYCEDIDCPNVTCKDCLVEHFKIRAREELKSE